MTLNSETQHQPQLSRRADIALKIALVLAGPLFLLLILEGVATVWEKRQAVGPYAWELVASRRIDLDLPEEGAGYTLMKPGDNYEYQGIPVVINEHGLRGPATSYEKAADTFRILNVGDSIAMGWGVRFEDTYGQQLAQLAPHLVSDSQRLEVVNVGVPGWNPDNALAYLQREGMNYNPDLLIFEVTIVNDIYGENAATAAARRANEGIIEWMRAHTRFWPFLTVQARWLQARASGHDRIAVIDPPTEPEKYFPLEASDDRWDKLWAPIAAMAKIADDREIPFILVLFPLEYQVLDEAYPTVPQTVLTARAEAEGIPVVDLLPRFQEACLAKPGGPCTLEDGYLFADVWMHPSALGHRLTAMELERTVLDIVEPDS